MAKGKRHPELPGTEAPHIPALDDAAAEYVAARDERMELTKSETKTREHLGMLLLEHADQLEEDEDGEKVYRYVDGERTLACYIEHGPGKVKVKVITDAPDPEPEVG